MTEIATPRSTIESMRPARGRRRKRTFTTEGLSAGDMRGPLLWLVLGVVLLVAWYVVRTYYPPQHMCVEPVAQTTAARSVR